MPPFKTRRLIGATSAEALAELLDNYPRDELIEELLEHQYYPIADVA